MMLMLWGDTVSSTAFDGFLLSHAAFTVFLDAPTFFESHAPDGSSAP